MLTRITAFFASRPLVAPLLSLVLILAVLAGVYMQGRSDKEISMVKEDKKQIEEGVRSYDTIQRKTLALPEPELDERLDRWMRD